VRGVVTNGFLKKIPEVNLKCVQSVRVRIGIRLDAVNKILNERE
jgi:hypothetical protein